MSVKLETWLQYWCQPHRVQYHEKDREAVEGFMIWMILHPSTVVTELDMLEAMKEEFPHLKDLLDNFERIELHRMAVDVEAIMRDVTDDEVILKIARHITEQHLQKGAEDGLHVINEFMCGKAKDGSWIQGDRDPATHQILMDAYDHIARTRGYSVLLNSDAEVTSISLGPDGTPKVDKLMGQAMIDRKVDEFRSAMESWMPKGGEEQ